MKRSFQPTQNKLKRLMSMGKPPRPSIEVSLVGGFAIGFLVGLVLAVIVLS